MDKIIAALAIIPGALILVYYWRKDHKPSEEDGCCWSDGHVSSCYVDLACCMDIGTCPHGVRNLP